MEPGRNRAAEAGLMVGRNDGTGGGGDTGRGLASWVRQEGKDERKGTASTVCQARAETSSRGEERDDILLFFRAIFHED
jgi:hypothetical protein